MRVVIDTNLWISGLLWRGLPNKLLRQAEAGHIELCMTPAMLSELAEVLEYARLAPRLAQLGLTPSELLTFATSLVTLFEDADGMRLVQADPDDDVFLHCAARVGAAYVVSGDRHLLNLEQYADIPILTVHAFLAREFPNA